MHESAYVRVSIRVFAPAIKHRSGKNRVHVHLHVCVYICARTCAHKVPINLPTRFLDGYSTYVCMHTADRSSPSRIETVVHPGNINVSHCDTRGFQTFIHERSDMEQFRINIELRYIDAVLINSTSSDRARLDFNGL